MTSSLAALEQLAALSEAMLGAASRGDWATLADHEATRRALADSLPASLSGSLPAAVQAEARTLIEACQRCDAGVRPLADARLSELRVVLRAAQRPGAQTP